MKGIGSESRRHQGSNCPHKAASFDKEHDGEAIDWSPASDCFAVPSRSHARNHSIRLDDTLYDTVPQLVDKKSWYRKVGSGVRHVGTNPGICWFHAIAYRYCNLRWWLPGDHVSICLAHLINGDIFWC